MDVEDEFEGKSTKRRRLFEDHRPLSELTAGVKNGTLHQGTLQVSRYCWHDGWISSSVGRDIRIKGVNRMNRAMAGGLCQQRLWTGLSSLKRGLLGKCPAPLVML